MNRDTRLQIADAFEAVAKAKGDDSWQIAADHLRDVVRQEGLAEIAYQQAVLEARHRIDREMRDNG